MENAGADAMTIHCRTRSQMYSGTANWEAISNIKNEIHVPVFVNGDITSPQSAQDALTKSKTDGVAIGRGILGSPDLIYRVEHFFSTGEILEELSIIQKLDLLKEHILSEINLRGEQVAIQFVRKFYPYYIRGIKDAAVYRGALVTENSLENIFKIINNLQEISNQ